MYDRIYTQLVSRARSRAKPVCYCERHHVVPRSMGGGDEEANLVWLTGREHFIAHWLLWKIHGTPSSARAWWRMACVAAGGRRYNSRNFERAREAFSKSHSGSNHHKSRAVECIDDGRVFPSARIAALAIGRRASSVSEAISKGQKVAGLRFKFVDEPAPTFKGKSGMPLKPVVCVCTGVSYESCRAAGESHGVHEHSIRVAIRRNRKSANLFWRWA